MYYILSTYVQQVCLQIPKSLLHTLAVLSCSPVQSRICRSADPSDAVTGRTASAPSGAASSTLAALRTVANTELTGPMMVAAAERQLLQLLHCNGVY